MSAGRPGAIATDDRTTERDSAGVIAPPPLVYLGGLAVGFVLEALLPSASLPGALAWPLGAVLLVAGLTLLRAFVRTLHRAGTPVRPDRATTAIVTSGPYRVSRNPGYLGMALVYLGIAVGARALWVLVPLIAVLAVVDRGVIAREERYLERTFGEQYLRYKAQVRRWL
jgi:protein-S-isoprenylcysteine O-methyltransferase Ste14